MRLIIFLLLLPSLVCAEIIDAVVATVDSQAITLSDLNYFIKGNKVQSISELQQDKDAQQILDKLINNKVLELECEARTITVSDAELEQYFNELSIKNNLSIDQLKAELSKQNIPFELYRQEVRSEILKGRLVNDLVRRGPGVSEQQINEYFETRPALNESGRKILLSQILISKNKRDAETARNIILELSQLLNSNDFSNYAKKYSEAPEANEGGSLGLFDESELSDFIKSAVSNLNAGEISAIVESDLGFHIFKLDKIFENQNEIKSYVRDLLKQQNMTGEISEFFNSKIMTKHVIERKYLN